MEGNTQWWYLFFTGVPSLGAFCNSPRPLLGKSLRCISPAVKVPWFFSCSVPGSKNSSPPFPPPPDFILFLRPFLRNTRPSFPSRTSYPSQAGRFSLHLVSCFKRRVNFRLPAFLHPPTLAFDLQITFHLLFGRQPRPAGLVSAAKAFSLLAAPPRGDIRRFPSFLLPVLRGHPFPFFWADIAHSVLPLARIPSSLPPKVARLWGQKRPHRQPPFFLLILIPFRGPPSC